MNRVKLILAPILAVILLGCYALWGVAVVALICFGDLRDRLFFDVLKGTGKPWIRLR